MNLEEEKAKKKLRIPVTNMTGCAQSEFTAAKADLKYKVQWRFVSSIQNKNKLVYKRT